MQEREVIMRLGKEYFYDVKKLQLLNKINAADEQSLENVGEDFTPEEKSNLKDLADRFSFDGYVRIRNDHYIKDDKAGTKTRTTRANMVHLQRPRARIRNEPALLLPVQQKGGY